MGWSTIAIIMAPRSAVKTGDIILYDKYIKSMTITNRKSLL